MAEPGKSSYLDTVVGRVNRHRMIALFVCVPAALVSLRVWSKGPVTPGESLLTVVFFVAAYAAAAASARMWPTRRRRALSGNAPPGTAQLWFLRALAVLCALLALLAAFAAFSLVRHA